MLRLERGQITISDLAQSESSLAGAQAQYIQVKNEVITSKLNYENIIGKIFNPSDLKKSSEAYVSIPQGLSNAINLSNDHAIEWITKNYKEFDILVTQGAGTISQLNNSIKEKWALKK